MENGFTYDTLWEKLRSGDEQALYDLYRAFYHPLFYAGMKVCRDGVLVRDCEALLLR